MCIERERERRREREKCNRGCECGDNFYFRNKLILNIYNI